MGLLKFLRGSAAAGGITGTGEWTQAAATWDATASERIPATATFEQAAASWDATASERFTSTAAFVQAAASWDAAALERYTAIAEWTQDAASWSALGMSAEDVNADGEWVQEAASWLAATSELVVGSGTWQQVNTWLAESVERFTSTATWSQSQSWESAGDVDNPVVPVDAEGAWTQAAATWSGLAFTPSEERPRFRPPFRVRYKVTARASFSQEPASWAAEMTMIRRDADIEELMELGAI